MEANKQSFFMSNSITIKAFMVAILTLLMLIPIGMVKSLVEERKEYNERAQEDITSKWGGQQQLTGPLLVLPYLKKINGRETKEYAYFLPEEYVVNGNVKPEQRSRGIYNILCYQADLKLNGKFRFPEYQKLGIDSANILWKDAFVVIDVSYLQGIKNKIVFNVNGKPQEIFANAEKSRITASGITIKMPIDEASERVDFKFDFDLSLNGSGGLYLTPIGRQTNINLKSIYNSVKFAGDFLPNNQNLSETGFDVQWDIFDYNRNFAQMWTGNNNDLKDSTLGVELLLPVNEYQKNMRSVKYAILFIALTFVVFFIVELTSRKPIHPVQYLLASFALVLFYSLLLALSEQIGFDWAFVVSAFAIISLLTAYSYSIFRTKKQTLFMGGFLTALYVFLYFTIQESEKSLLFGSIGLFIVLAIVMYVSRKINWYKKDEPENNNTPESNT